MLTKRLQASGADRTSLNCQSENAFSLIELLIVVAVVSLLIGLLYPALVRAREQARKTACASNLRQIGLALMMYTADYDESFPNDGNPYLWWGRYWRWLLMPYLGLLQMHSGNPLKATSGAPDVFLCPSDYIAPQRWDSTSYGYSAAFYHSAEQINQMRTEDLYMRDPTNYPFPNITQKLAQVTYPSHKAIVAEWLTNHDPDVKVGWWDWRGSRNYLFVDGHVKFLRAAEILPAVNGYPDINLTKDGISGRDIW
ncbi:MAG: DUF1559 domain-containing protein [Armatimonadota bacterium]|nr:DUF1559 domain-containing protein [Armatimonadota bacterium]MCX7778367.1 DUF1559 domain-containing protein [Armatimonadota bacterium]MDW8026361.1 DUF1559 domain-containing protein [Armatimonadota bacterium]